MEHQVQITACSLPNHTITFETGLMANQADGAVVVRKLYDHDKCYFFQGTDGRIIFAIPYEDDFTLIGTTDKEHDRADDRPRCTEEEKDYLVKFASGYFKQPISEEDMAALQAEAQSQLDEVFS